MLGFKSITDQEFSRAKRDTTVRLELMARLRRQQAWFRRLRVVFVAIGVALTIIMFLSWRDIKERSAPVTFEVIMNMFMFTLLLIVGHANAAESTKCNLMIKALILTSGDENERLLDGSNREHKGAPNA